MGLQYADIPDAVNQTQQHFIKKGSFVDLQTDLQDHVAVREMWQGRKKVFDGGDDWRFEAQVDHNHSARTVDLYEVDGSILTDTMINGTVKPRHVNAHYIFDLREKAFQSGGRAIVDLVKTRYTAMVISVYELLEDMLWSKPVDDTDTKTPFGVAFWVTKNATEGFNGGNPVGFSSGRAGISTTTNPRWANWTAQYTLVSKADLLRKMRTAHRRSQFRSPVSHANPDLGSMRNGIYTNDNVIGLLEEVCEDQNMNLGNDLDSKGGRVLFKGTPLTYAPKLNGDSSDPIYMLDWKYLAIGVLAGWENQVTAPYMVPNKHLVRRVDLDASLNMICTNLRAQAVISK